MGGNIEALPIDLLMIGSTSSATQREFLLNHGYRDTPHNQPAIQLTVLGAAPAQARYPDAHITLPRSRDDVWLQDFGEIMAVKTYDQPQERLLLFDTARDRGLDNLAIYLADRWDGAYLDSPQTGNRTSAHHAP